MMPPIDDARYESIESYKELRESLEENLRELKTQPGSFGMNLVGREFYDLFLLSYVLAGFRKIR